MAIGFSEIPAATLVPWVYVEISDRFAGIDSAPFRTLLVAQRLAAGRVAAGTLTRVGGADDAEAKFGTASMLHLMTAQFRAANPLGDLWAIALDDPSSGSPVAPKPTITASGAPTAAGTAVVYVAGRRITAGVLSAATPTQVAAALVEAINAAENLPATAAAAAAVVTVTGRHVGAGVDLDVRTSLYPEDAQPPGLILTAAAVAGTGEVDVSGALDIIPNEAFDLIVHPYTTTTALDALETDIDARWHAARQLDGAGISARRGTLGQQNTFAAARTSRHTAVMDMSDAPQPNYEWAAQLGGRVALSASADPALPFQTVELPGLIAPTTGQRRTPTERQGLLTDGMATHTVDAGGRVRIERLVTTSGSAKWRDLNTVLTVSYLRRNFRERMQSKFARFKLADDGTRIRPGQPIITPSDGRREAIAWAADMEAAGLVENAAVFKDALVVRRNANDPNRLDFLLPPDIINQLRIIGALLEFRQ